MFALLWSPYIHDLEGANYNYASCFLEHDNTIVAVGAAVEVIDPLWTYCEAVCIGFIFESTCRQYGKRAS